MADAEVADPGKLGDLSVNIDEAWMRLGRCAFERGIEGILADEIDVLIDRAFDADTSTAKVGAVAKRAQSAGAILDFVARAEPGGVNAEAAADMDLEVLVGRLKSQTLVAPSALHAQVAADDMAVLFHGSLRRFFLFRFFLRLRFQIVLDDLFDLSFAESCREVFRRGEDGARR